jgi:hypothetical protein
MTRQTISTDEQMTNTCKSALLVSAAVACSAKSGAHGWQESGQREMKIGREMRMAA